MDRYAAPLAKTNCLICGLEALYAGSDRQGHKIAAPKTCGRLACMVKTGEMTAV